MFDKDPELVVETPEKKFCACSEEMDIVMEDDDEEEMNKMRRVTRRKRLKLNVPIAAQLILIPQDSDPGIRLDLLPI